MRTTGVAEDAALPASEPGPGLRLQVSDIHALESTRLAVLDFLAPFAPDARTVYAVELVLEEVLSNQFKYAFADAVPQAVALGVWVEGGEIELSFEDSGVAFDPLHAPELPVPASIDEAPIGGLGLMLVRRFATSAAYERSAGRNLLTVRIGAP